jgi:hypothetical protein
MEEVELSEESQQRTPLPPNHRQWVDYEMENLV